ncbi:DUF924 domain-containing protein [Nodosilinea sp. FACHB-131]|uniref:DUF924 family protein n=1 Tax=Cyanophyceae TaxID=3028117 RepID=UPI001685B581|nr:DUF924 family protein [Nodosilinea sp. FACHB-131]MBD1873395.1 DUF924 domain-containing protein [Nodosilinea sp. FACHB-131]
MITQPYESVLQFWFPDQLNQGQAAIVRQWQWWFRGGMSASENERFLPLLEQAIRGKLDGWAEEPRSRLALIILLDQFSRTIYQGTAQAFAQDSKACLLALEGINVGHYTALRTPWEKTFFLLPLGHAEGLKKLDLAVQLAEELVQEALPEHRELLAFSASQARAHREVIARFGRQPHRNALLGRPSTPEELDYLATGQLVHTRSMPPHLSALLNDA